MALAAPNGVLMEVAWVVVPGASGPVLVKDTRVRLVLDADARWLEVLDCASDDMVIVILLFIVYVNN